MLKNVIKNKNILFSYKPEEKSILSGAGVHVLALTGYAIIYRWDSPEESNLKSALKKFSYSDVATI